jgi:hypothetical protein
LGHIRPFHEPDIPQTADLHREVFELQTTPDIKERYRKYFLRTFLCPSIPGGPSLVYEEDDGRITGFLGIVGRRFILAGRNVSAALSTQFVVHKEARKRFVGVMMLREHLMGPQDLSFTDEANDNSRRIWEQLGGTTAATYSVHWIAPLKPGKYFAFRGATRWKRLMQAATPVASVADAAFFYACRRLYKSPVPAVTAETLPVESVPELISGKLNYSLKPCYDANELQGRMDGSTSVLLRGPAGRVAGWYIYQLSKDGIAEVLQVGCNTGCARDVVAHLFADAAGKRAIALAGRLEPHIAQALPASVPILYGPQRAMLIHSTDLRLLETIRSGDALLSRIDGEWSVRFR